MNPPGGMFDSGAVWHTIVFKVSASRGGFSFLGPKQTDVAICSNILGSILITIVIDRMWFSQHFQCITTVGVVFTIYSTVAWEIKGVQYIYSLVLKQTFCEIELFLHKK